MNQYLIALGSSIEPRHSYLDQCEERIRSDIGPILKQSHRLSTKPFGGQAQLPFLNSALICQTPKPELEVLEQLLLIEKDLGRKREIRWSDRTIDCDIILAKDQKGQPMTSDHPNLKIPHPECHLRDFVLIPCCEIAGDWVHPHLHKSLQQLLSELKSTND